ncbi:Hpt domain-containing protein [Phreatobacter sp.]|uniref:Hpt domain-containing protein n=1 Tax=Phreatobacter sp. TaxID=1966341 RepID=UPI0022CC5A28|nr:Hpt domain-containing protein [Phreatobacter sp.]MCZ8314892.1 Hpt domain-containing protein [Phreatobacter sp.]
MTNPPATKTPIKPTARTGKKGGLDEASIDTFADHEVVTPKRTLKSFSKKAKIKVDEFGFDMEAIERAEAALQELSSEFEDWMAKEVERLTKARDAIAATGFDAANRAAVYTAAHDLKGEAATFGYPLAGRVAESLCALLDGIADDTRLPVALVLQHVDAIRAIVRENAKGTDHPVAVTLSERLGEATTELLVAVNGAPSIVP